MAGVEDEHGKCGFIDKTGEVVVPCQWEYAESFSDGLASVIDEHWKFGFIDKTGEEVIPCQWKLVWPFSEGLARVEDEHGNWWTIEKTSKVLIPGEWNREKLNQTEELTAVKDFNDNWGFSTRRARW